MMGRMARWMIRLYPASWRARYGDEIDALLSDTGADVRIVGDLARGGMRMQLKAWPFPLLALALGLAGLLTGAGISFLIPASYVSEAVLRIDSGHLTMDQLDLHRAEQTAESRTNLSRIIMELGLYRNDLKVEPLEDVIVEMKQHIQIDPITIPGSGAAFQIRFDYGDRIKAQQTVAALVARLEKEIPRWNPRQNGARVTVLEIPSLPNEPMSPTKTIVWGGGFLASALIAATAWIRRRFVWVAAGVGIIGIVAAFYGADLHLWPGTYRSTATVALRTAQPGGADAVSAEILKPEVLSEIANDPRLRLYGRAMEKEPLDDVLRRMRDHLAVSEHTWRDGDGTEITLAFEYYDRYKAQQTLQILIGKLIDLADRRLAPPVETTTAVPAIEILDQASTPIDPVKPNRYLIAGTGGICGVFLAGIISLLRRRWSPPKPALLKD